MADSSKHLMADTNQEKLRLILLGNPNSGKTSLFNKLTGLNQRVGNFPGVTVEKKQGSFKVSDQLKAEVIDLPGTYGLTAVSEDERVALNYLQEDRTDGFEEIILVVADATNLKRNLLLLEEVRSLKKRCILVLNMMDVAQQNDLEIDHEKISDQLAVPIVPMNARIGKGLDQLKNAIEIHLNATNKNDLEQSKSVSPIAIQSLLNKYVIKKGESKSSRLTTNIDKLLLHPFLGFAIFLTILFLLFQAIFSWSTIPMDIIDEGFMSFGQWVSEQIPEGVLNDLIVNGVLAGLGGIVIFIPQIALLFLFIAVLEDTGYLARVSFMMDKLLRGFGLNGRSVIPLLSGAACAVPAIMSARIIGNKKERLLTIFVTPLISCSARIPVYTLLIALVIPAEEQIWSFNLQGIVMMFLYLIGFATAIITAFFLKKIVKSNERSHFIMEMPIYRKPRWTNIGITVFNKVKLFLFEAGKIIIAVSILLWALSSYGPSNEMEILEEKYSNLTDEDSKTLLNTEKLEASYVGHIGKFIEPAIKPLGFDWKIGIGVITSFAAREVFVGTMATLYSVGDEDNSESIKEKMEKARDPETGEKIYSKATAYSLMIFYAFALQCMATLAIVVKETGGWKWPLIQLTYMSLLAYLSSLLVYQLFV